MNATATATPKIHRINIPDNLYRELKRQSQCDSRDLSRQIALVVQYGLAMNTASCDHPSAVVLDYIYKTVADHFARRLARAYQRAGEEIVEGVRSMTSQKPVQKPVALRVVREEHEDRPA
jgi:hypothetical protein